LISSFFESNFRLFRHFARATGQRGKTDAIDAAVLSAYGQALQPKPTAPRTEQEQQLTELIRRRLQVLEILVAQRQRAERLTLPALRRQAQSLVRRLEQDVAQIDEQLKALRTQAAALAGLAPHPRESGQWHGRRSIGGGHAPVRRALYMAALVAARTNRQFKAFYQRLRAAGKPAKVALTAVMRKLIVLMNHILKNPNFTLQN